MTNRKNVTVISIVLVLIGLLFVAGCSDSNNSQNNAGNGRILMNMVDDPATEFEHVYIEIIRVEVHQADADSNSGWIVVCSIPGIYDLLTLTNGLDTVLVDTMLAPGHYTQIRLYLSDNNSVVVNGQSYPLEIPGAQQSGLKLNHPFDIEPNVLYELTLDFNAEDEIHWTGNGYMMNPVIRVQANAISGSISGTVAPPAARPRVWTVATPDTISTYADSSSGYFCLVCLPIGIYSVHIDPTIGVWQDTTINNVQIIAGQNTDLGTIILSP